jgi:hypothetical protein
MFRGKIFRIIVKRQKKHVFMKRSILIPAFFLVASSCFAQTQCSQSNPIFRTDNYGAAKEVYSFGSNPEFPFLRNLSTPQQVANAMKKGIARHGMAELNRMMMDIGFTNGVKDVTAAYVTEDYVATGTPGNMGDGNFSTAYIKLMGGDQGVKTWKISSPTGCYVYILAKCGNAFYPAKPATKATTSLDVPLNLNTTSNEVTLESSATKTTTGSTYVYYYKTKHRNRAEAHKANVNDPCASEPVLLNTTKKVEAVPQTYKVTVSTPENSVKVYEDKPLDVTANINVEKISEYAGYYPTATKKQYTEVSKRVYRKSERKMRHAINKEEKVARLTNIDVNTDVPVKK